VAESEGRIGGSSRLADAWLQAAGTSVQRRDGIVDSPEAMYEFYTGVNRWQVEASLARAYCDDGPAVIDWLRGLGVEFGPVARAGAEAVPRGHPTVGQGEALVGALERACEAVGVEFALGNRIDDLVVVDGRVAGVRARGEVATADAVVIAAGGFARNPSLARRLLAGRLLVEDPPSTAAPGSLGDGLVIAERIGAALVGHDRAHWVPAPFTPGESILVTRDATRFVDESLDHSVRTAAAAYHGHTYCAVFDERIRRTAARDPFVARTPSAFLFCDEPLAVADPPVSRWVAAGRLRTAARVRDLAVESGLDPDRLQGTVDRYNRSCAEDCDDAFGKPARFLVPLVEPPFYLLKVGPAALVATFCGLRIDRHGRVLDRRECVIPGLYAAGESAGGVVGEVYVGHGNSLTSALVFGRRAGAHAASRRVRV
jgi:fumarate reductase flavoprotein subunit